MNFLFINLTSSVVMLFKLWKALRQVGKSFIKKIMKPDIVPHHIL